MKGNPSLERRRSFTIIDKLVERGKLHKDN
jgi:hypothetical protein